jgi:hypothetical protein
MPNPFLVFYKNTSIPFSISEYLRRKEDERT